MMMSVLRRLWLGMCVDETEAYEMLSWAIVCGSPFSVMPRTVAVASFFSCEVC